MRWHLVMPGQLDESEAIFRWLASELGKQIVEDDCSSWPRHLFSD